MAAVDASYKFLYVDVGTNGRVFDGGVWSETTLKAAIENKLLDIPSESPLPNSDKVAPYVFVADDAFPRKSYLMKPIPHRSQLREERIFSDRLSRENSGKCV